MINNVDIVLAIARANSFEEVRLSILCSALDILEKEYVGLDVFATTIPAEQVPNMVKQEMANLEVQIKQLQAELERLEKEDRNESE